VDELFIVDDIDELATVWEESNNTKIPSLVLGSGANVAFADEGFRGRIFSIKLANFKKLLIDDPKYDFWYVESGINLQQLIKNLADLGYDDLIDLTGIPGTLGGAVRGNAGAFGHEISDFIVAVQYVDNMGNINKVTPNKCAFAYRESIFKRQKNWIVVSIVFKFKKPKSPDFCQKVFQEKLRERLAKNPSGRSGGSFFKNPYIIINNQTCDLHKKDKKFFAGEILEKLGAKGDKQGDIQISQQHANFFMNLGKGKQSDLIILAKKWQKLAYKKYGILLEPEVALFNKIGNTQKLFSPN